MAIAVWTVWFLLSVAFVDHAGYWLHRWAHRRSSGPLFRAHMTHHVKNYPPADFFSERYRSSGKDNLGIWFAPFGVVYLGAWLLLGLPHPWAVGVGLAVAGGLNALVHDLTHISRSVVWRSRLTMGAAVRHHAHHHKMGRNFGVVTTLWDRIYGTRGAAATYRARPPARHL